MGLLNILNKKNKSSNGNTQPKTPAKEKQIPSPYKTKTREEEIDDLKNHLFTGTFTEKSPQTIRKELAAVDQEKAQRLQREEIRAFNERYFNGQ
eukprot:CAMPEP_0117437220 /NCGR_PEP_ID=MMETSP0759-20121206/1412_1 /TAXON_ID=63605 /ORGANISM="Percolomonas cosmopolitus, Strain WS" /LENGTH=93 /DNA_ID=CAMNT_0005228847 /DNA_START=55 /DNA_END=336 /DNA_ORIENTATION=+